MNANRRRMMCCLVATAVLLGGFGLSVAQTPTSVSRELKIGTSRPGGLLHTSAAGISQILNKYTRMRAKVISTVGPVSWVPMMERGEIDVGIINVFDCYQAYYGEMIFKEATKGKGYDIRILSLGSPSTLGFFVPIKSDIKKIPDIRGKKYPRFTELSLDACFKGFLANAGLTYDDVIPVPRTSLYDTVVDDLQEGKIDGVTMTFPSAKLVELDTTIGIRAVSADSSPVAMRRTREVFPFYAARTEKGTGIKEPANLLSYNTTLSARGDFSDDLAYEIVKTIWQHYEELGAIHENLKTWTPEVMVSTNATIPYHPGAIKWYKEKGVWTSELERQQKLLIKK